MFNDAHHADEFLTQARSASIGNEIVEIEKQQAALIGESSYCHHSIASLLGTPSDLL